MRNSKQDTAVANRLAATSAAERITLPPRSVPAQVAYSLAGISKGTLYHWMDQGHIRPTFGARRPSSTGGSYALLVPLSTAIGVVLASRLRRSGRGCSAEFAASILRAFATTSEDGLVQAFQRGDTHLTDVRAVDGTYQPVLGDGQGQPESANCLQALRDILAQINTAGPIKK
jgi:hypothetical protein